MTTSGSFSGKLCLGEVGYLLKGPAYGLLRLTVAYFKRFGILSAIGWIITAHVIMGNLTFTLPQ